MQPKAHTVVYICFSYLRLNVQVETKAVAQDAKSSTEIPGVPPPVRLVVNATSPSQVSSTPILGNEAASGMVRKGDLRTLCGLQIRDVYFI